MTPTTLGLDDERPERRTTPRRRREDHGDPNSKLIEVMKILFPILLAWGLAYVTARTEAADTVKTEIAVVKEREEQHFNEIQRTLKRIDDWMAREDQRRPTK